MEFHRDIPFKEGSIRRNMFNWLLIHKVGNLITFDDVFEEYNKYGIGNRMTIRTT